MNRGRWVAVVAATALSASALVASVPAEARGPAEIVEQVTYAGKTVTVRLRPVTLRSPGFEVLVQQSDGSFDTWAAPPERAYLGGVDGVPGAVSSGIIKSDGTFDGQIVFDRGAVWQFNEGTVYSTRGLTPPTAYKWPSAADASRNVTVSPGQVGGTTYRWDIGYDLNNIWFTDPATINGSVAKALDAVELATVSLLDVYVPNALLRPAVGRVVLRAAAGHDPYPSGASFLGTARTEWATNQADADVDDVALFHGSGGGGGVAYVGTAGTDWGVSANGGTGAPRAVLRHELGHTWGALDNHTNGPEGATIESGNAYERFDGTELSAIMRYRDSRQQATAPFTPLGRFAEPVPPYAALDLVDLLTEGVPHAFRPLANDHDANRDRLSLLSVPAASHLGGKVWREGDAVHYLPPEVAKRTVDWVEYVVQDASGKRATGVSLFRIDPRTNAGPVSSWPRASLVRRIRYEVVNTQSALLAGVAKRFTKPGPAVQSKRGGDRTRWVAVPRGTAYRLRNVDARGCLAVSGRQVVVDGCRAGRHQLWRVVAHPKLGSAIVSVRTGRCLTPARGSMGAGARLVNARCSVAHSRSWDFRAPAVDQWKPVATPTAPVELAHVATRLRAGVPGTTTGISELVLRAPSGNATRFGVQPQGEGTVSLRNVQSDKCVDVYGSSSAEGAQVATWTCGGAMNQRWRLLTNPAGGVAIRSAISGLCLAPGDTGFVQTACGFAAKQRWRLG